MKVLGWSREREVFPNSQGRKKLRYVTTWNPKQKKKKHNAGRLRFPLDRKRRAPDYQSKKRTKAEW